MRRALLFWIAALSAAPLFGQERVTVDFASDQGPATFRASGILLSISATEPDDALVAPLKPRLVRISADPYPLGGPTSGGFAAYERLTRLGATVQILLSDSYSYRPGGPWPGDGGDWRRWEDRVEQLVRRAQQRGYHVQWDVWNEPNGPHFWGRSQEQFLETWRRGVLKIRAVDPQAVVVGPSTGGYRADYLQAFLQYAKAHDVLPDILSWHEMRSSKEIVAHVREIRAYMAQNGIAIRDICLNEVIGRQWQLEPGATLGFLAALERAGVVGACHACWPDKNPRISNCRNNSLDGLLTHPDRQPRSTWWAYKAYSDATGRLVELTPSTTVDGVASLDASAGLAHLAMGREGGSRGPVELVLTHLDQADYLLQDGKIRVDGRRIPTSGWDALPRPLPAVDMEVSVRNGQCAVVLPQFGPSDAYSVTLGSSAARPPGPDRRQ